MQCLVCIRPCVGEEFRDLEDVHISFWTSFCEIFGIEGGNEYDFKAFQKCHICDACFGVVRKSQEVLKRLKELQSELHELGTKLKHTVESSLLTEDHLSRLSEDVNRPFGRVRKLLTSKYAKVEHCDEADIVDFWAGDEVTVNFDDDGEIQEPTENISEEEDSCLNNQECIEEYTPTDEEPDLAELEDQEIQPATPAHGTNTSPTDFGTYNVQGFVLKDCEVRIERLSQEFISEAVRRSNLGSISSASKKADKGICQNRGEQNGRRHTRESQKSNMAERRWKCRGCDQVFDHIFDLMKHQKVTRVPNSLTGEHKCDDCEERYDTMCGLRFHYSKKHAKSKWINVMSHKRCKCRSCDQVFERNFDLVKHHEITRAPNNLTGEHRCDTCEEKYDTMCGLRYHYSKKHAGSGQNGRPRCKTCLESFDSWPLLFEHKKLCYRPTDTQKEETCPICGRLSKNLREHMRCHGDKKHVCDICGKGFLKARELTHHVITHSKEKPYTCELFKGTRNVMSHKRCKCRSCDQVFERNFDLVKHHQTTRAPNNLTGEHRCDTCEERYDTMCGLRYHYSKKHAGSGQNGRPRCKTCLESFDSWPLLFEHKKLCYRPTDTQKEETCPICGRQSKNLREHMRCHGDKKHVCDICGKGFLKARELTHHLITHSKEKPYTCELCGKGVACLKTHLNTCLERRQESEKNFVCAHCGKAFFLEFSLNRHEYWQHSSLDRFECDVCHQKFRSKCFLQMHRRRIHFPEERIPCSMCSASFVRKYELKLHIESEHLDSVFKCSTCNVEFKTRRNLQRHELQHKFGKRYECQVCGKKFGNTSHLKRHEAIHDKKSKK